MADALGLRLIKLSRPINFEQVDGSLLGGAPVSQVTDLGGYRRMRLVVGPQPPVTDRENPYVRLPPAKLLGKERIKVAVEASESKRLFPVEYEDLKDVFSERECDALPPHRSTDCAIDIIPGAKLPKPRMYPMSPKELEELRRYIDKNLGCGFIQPARSRIAAPVIFQGKKDGGLRLCMDFRGLNAVCTENMYPLPLLKDMLTHLSQGRVFTKLDLREAYYRIRIKPGDEWKTAFNCPLGSFQFTVMPFGLKGAPAVFMQTINAVLHEHLYHGVLVYLDDILIYSKTMEEHIRLVREVLHKLLQAQLFVKLSKCEFHKTRIEYLGYKISASGIEMDPAKVKAVLEWQVPRTRRQLQSFLGFANFYRQFVPDFARVALPLTELLKTRNSPVKSRPSQPLAWSRESQAAFEHLKTLFAKEPILLHPDPDKQYIVQADASDVAVGAVLLQRNTKGELQPCAYTSRKLSETERRWAIWEKEAFAIKWALVTWRHLLEGAKQEIEIWTDHKNLTVLQSPRRLAPKHVRWAQYFKRFTFQLKYVPGGRNFLADALSRLPQYESQREDLVQAILPPYTQGVGRVSSRPNIGNFESELRAAIPQDLWFREHRNLFTQRDGLVWFGVKLYVPLVLRPRVLQRCHDAKLAGHFGFVKTLHLTRCQFWWPTLRKDVEHYVKACSVCATCKSRPGRPVGCLQPVADPEHPWQDIAMDFIVELPSSKGHTVIWTVIDLFSKQAHFVPCRKLPTAQKLAHMFLTHIYRIHGAPRRIISDRGVQFTARFWKGFTALLGSSQGLSTAYHPATNGTAERANAAVERYLRSYVSYQQANWADLLVFVEVAYNNAVHTSTGFAPFKVVSGKDFVPIPECRNLEAQPYIPREWVQRVSGARVAVKTALVEYGRKMKEQADKKRQPCKPFIVGQLVYLSTKYLKLRIPCRKLGPKYIGPFKIVRIINPVTVQLQLPRLLGKVHPVFHCSLIKPVYMYRKGAEPGPVVGGEYEVQDILDSRIKQKKLYYLIKWKGYPLSDATWVRADDVRAPRLVKQFHVRHPRKPTSGSAARVGKGDARESI
ncbi:hypothetical protein NXF25_019159 [Crotalus adamanteus]|uniref:Gypsy retrotransposon integrase-like protein 1 n=1 Tax=Crotalus adamanteus TaxID=8729 RepID=A0AAW1B1D7_CROAD